MKTRMFLGLAAVLALAAVLLVYWAGAARKTSVRVGLIPFVPIHLRTMEGVKSALAERGFVDGRNVEYRMMPPEGKIDALPGQVDELLRWRPDVVFVVSTPASRAVAKATANGGPAVVFGPVSDPIDAGLVKDLRHPGGHMTGVRLANSAGLRLEWLLRIVPGVKRLYVPYSENDKSSLVSLEQFKAAAKLAGVELVTRPIRSEADIAGAAREVPDHVQAIVLPQDGRLEAKAPWFVETANKRRLPLSAPSSLQVEEGALMSFGFDNYSIGRQGGRLVAEILLGAQAGDLPVETAQNLLVLNLATAQAIGLGIDDAILRQAHRLVR